MKREIERRFLVHGKPWQAAGDIQAAFFRQGYLHAAPDCTVRVRLEESGADRRAWLTIKGPTVGAGRDEFEYPIPIEDAEQLLAMVARAGAGQVEKWRRVLNVRGSRWEVDEFIGENTGLVLAEIELEHEAQDFARPDWLGEEVTRDARYANARLAAHPYSRW